MKLFTDGTFCPNGPSEPVFRGGCTLDQCFLGTSVPTEENEAADVSSRTNMAYMIVFVRIFLKFGADID